MPEHELAKLKEELHNLNEMVTPINNTVGLIRNIGYLVSVIVLAILAVAGWVWHTNTALAEQMKMSTQTDTEIRQIQTERAAVLKEWTDWRTQHLQNEGKVMEALNGINTILTYHQNEIDADHKAIIDHLNKNK